MRFDEALADLASRQPESMPEPDLSRISRLAELLDHPERTYPSIQITGTNGKTTTARIVTALACAHGLATGTFVSPHMRSVTERMSVCGRPISDEVFAETYAYLRPFLEQVDGPSRRVTYFETLTALAFAWFADVPVGLGVFEVGMGGRWDATNLVRGEVGVLCPIGLDHVGILGDTVEEIAAEKAGIIKPGSSAVVRRQRPEARRVLETRGAEVGAALLVEGDAWGLDERVGAVGGQAITVRGLHARYEQFVLPLFGDEAARNAAAAIVALEALLGRALDEDAVRGALAGVSSPGRMEVAGHRPLVVLDGAHNPDAVAALVATLRESFTWERLHLVVGMFEDKDVESVAALLAPLAGDGDRVHAARPASPRAADPARVAAAFAAGGAAGAATHDSVAAAVAEVRRDAGPADLILVTGSFYTVADARPLFAGEPPDEPG